MSFNWKIAIIAVITGGAAIFVDLEKKLGLYPPSYNQSVTLNSTMISTISPFELAEKIMGKNHDLLVIDMRDSAEYACYHIPGAKRFESLNTIAGEKQVVLCFDDTLLPESIPPTLHAESLYILQGGLNGWKDLVLFPDLKMLKIRDKAIIPKIIAASRYFGGSPKNIELYEQSRDNSTFREGC